MKALSFTIRKAIVNIKDFAHTQKDSRMDIETTNRRAKTIYPRSIDAGA